MANPDAEMIDIGKSQAKFFEREFIRESKMIGVPNYCWNAQGDIIGQYRIKKSSTVESQKKIITKLIFEDGSRVVVTLERQ